MILITSSGEFSFFSLFSILLSVFFFSFKKKKGLFFVVLCCPVFQQECMLQWVKNAGGRLVNISIP